MKVGQVITRMNIGGAQESVLLMCRGLVEMGDDVTLLTGPSDGPEGKMLEKMPPPPTLKIIDIPHMIREICPISDFLAYKELYNAFKSHQFDVVHTNSSKAGILARIAAWKAGVPCVVHTVHGQAFHRYQTPLKNKIYIAFERFAAKYCHKIYAVANAMIKQCVDAKVALPEKYELIYTGMELAPYLNAKADPLLRKQLSIPEDATVIGTIARMFPHKGYEELMPCAIELVKKSPKVHFLFLGDGILRKDFESQIKDNNLEANFHFTGMIPPTEIPKHAALFNFLVHFSLHEGLPRGVVQALAAAKPVIAFNLDGTPEVVLHEKTGLLLEHTASKGERLAAMERLTNDPEYTHQLGLAGRERVRQDFDWEYMAKVTRKSYESLLLKNKQ